MAEDRSLSIFRFLEKLKAGLGAAGLVAVLGEGLFSSGLATGVFGLGLPVVERLGNFGVVGLSVVVFFVVSLLSDISADEAKRETSKSKPKDQ